MPGSIARKIVNRIIFTARRIKFQVLSGFSRFSRSCFKFQVISRFSRFSRSPGNHDSTMANTSAGTPVAGVKRELQFCNPSTRSPSSPKVQLQGYVLYVSGILRGESFQVQFQTVGSVQRFYSYDLH